MVTRLAAKKPLLSSILLLFLLAACSRSEGVQIVGGWVTEPIGNVKNSAAYFTIKNGQGAADRLIGASTPLAARAELHTHVMDNGVVKMRRVSDVEIPAGQNVRFEPGGLHVMLIGLQQPLKAGDQVPLSLTFENAGAVEVQLSVRQR